MPTITSGWLTPRETAAHTGIAYQTLANMRCKSYKGTPGPPFIKRGGIVRYEVEQVDKYLKKSPVLEHRAKTTKKEIGNV